MSIHSRIKAKRLALGLSEQALANMVGVTRASVQQWEREGGTAPKRSTQEKVAKALQISLAELLGADVAPHPTAESIPPYFKGLGVEEMLAQRRGEKTKMETPEGAGADAIPAAQPVNVSRIAPPSLRQALDILGDAVKASPNKDLGGEIGVLLTAYVKNPDNKSLVDTIISLINPGQANGGTAQVPPCRVLPFRVRSA